MLLIAKSLRGLSFPKLMEVYVEGNRENGGDRYPGETPDPAAGPCRGGLPGIPQPGVFCRRGCRVFHP